MILVVVSNILYFHPYLGKWSKLTNIFQMGWNHQLVMYLSPATIFRLLKQAALKRDGLAIRFASDEHKLDRAFGLLAVKQRLAMQPQRGVTKRYARWCLEEGLVTFGLCPHLTTSSCKIQHICIFVVSFVCVSVCVFFSFDVSIFTMTYCKPPRKPLACWGTVGPWNFWVMNWKRIVRLSTKL